LTLTDKFVKALVDRFILEAFSFHPSVEEQLANSLHRKAVGKELPYLDLGIRYLLDAEREEGARTACGAAS